MPVFGNADAGVLHGKQHPGVLPLNAQDHLTLVGEFECVAQQVDQHLHEAVTVGMHPLRQLVIQLDAVGQVHALDPREKQLEGVLYRFAQFKGFRLNHQMTRLRLRIVQDVVDHRHQVIGRLARVVEHFAGLGLVTQAGQQQSIEAQNGVHRCAQFMADGGDEMFTHL